ncbi:Hypothetical predicted protein, partial [Paramuricea clavata]
QNNNIRFQLKETNFSAVFVLLSKLSRSKATGLDKISSRLLRECSDLIAESLSYIFNRSIVSGVFPDEWKHAKVVPIHKQGKRNCPDNYRPISIVSVVAKVFERIIYDQLYLFLSENSLLTNCQSGFRGLHSTVTALLEAANDWAYNIDHGSVNAVLFLDFRKAFDTVDHEILLGKLNSYGINGVAGNWFRSCLSERKQKCFVNGHFSTNRLLRCEVPQGTILGPLLFLIYINDLPNCLSHSRARMYADDTHLTYASNDIDDIDHHFNEDLAKVSEWLVETLLGKLDAENIEYYLVGMISQLSRASAASEGQLGYRPESDKTDITESRVQKTFRQNADKRTYYKKHAPLRTKRVKASKAPWISSHLKDWHIFKKMRNSVNQNIARAKENYFKLFVLLSKLSRSKATGLDKISSRLLRECPSLIAESLSYIFNRSIVSGVFPDEWKHAKVVPIHKQGKLAKVFERIIYDQLYLFLSENSLLTNCQKAFDTVDHEILLGKKSFTPLRSSPGNYSGATFILNLYQ